VLVSACKRLPNNAEAFFHMGLFHLRNADGEDALRAFQRAKAIFDARAKRLHAASIPIPPRLTKSVARLRAHTAQAAHLAASSKLSREERAPLLDRLQADLVASTAEDSTRPDVWNALALLHLGEGGFHGARDVLRTICDAFPDYVDAVNNLGLAELALGNEHAAVACFQKAVLADVRHCEALSNYGLVLLRRGAFDAASRMLRAAVDGAGPHGFGLAFAWGGLAVAEAANGRLREAESAAAAAESAADSVSRSRFTLLLGCIRARRVSDTLCRGVVSFDGRASPLAKAPAASGPPCSAAKRGRGAGGGTAVDTENDNALLNSSRANGPARDGAAGDGAEGPGDADEPVGGPRHAIEGTVSVLRGVARDIRSSSSNAALGAALRVRHDYLWEETGNRNYGAESAERLVEALEADGTDSSAWVQLALLQLGAGEYESARDFCSQAVAQAPALEAGWNALAASCQLNGELNDAVLAYERAVAATEANCNQKRNLALLHTQRADPPLGEQDNVASPGSAAGGLSAGSEAASFQSSLLLLTDANADEARGVELNRAGLSSLAAIYNNLGNARRQEGKRFVEAQAAYEKSLRLGGESPAVYNNLGLLYIAMDRLDDAEKMLTHALSIAPFFDASVSNLLKLRRLMRERRRAVTPDPAVGATEVPAS
jgi:tetratricopeptide (TPR) repeat protein